MPQNRYLRRQTLTLAELASYQPCNLGKIAHELHKFIGDQEEFCITSQLVRRARIAGVLRPYWFAARVLPDAVYHERFGTKLYHAVVQAGEAALSYCRDGYEGAEAVVDIDKVNYIDWELFYEAAVRTLIALIEEGERENYAKQQ